MTEQEQQIAIAEACPTLFEWHRFADGSRRLYWNTRNTGRAGEADPLHDLNAMHEAEKTLDDLAKFGKELAKVLQKYDGSDWPEILPPDVGPIAHAGAIIRTEAFLRTIGKWKD